MADYRPLAERMRPSKLSEVAGQDHLIGQGKILSEIINKNIPTSLIFWGPAGSGKTTLARILAQKLDCVFIELSAVTSGKADITKVIEDAKVNRRLGQNTILFIDEIHRFSKTQQDAFLPHVENGTITLIGATTENPAFEIISPLISRSKVLALEPLSDEDLTKIIRKTSKAVGIASRRLPKKSVDLLVGISSGDARMALGVLELANQLTKGVITQKIIESAAQKRTPKFDKKGENHYNVISAFIKSMRGGDPDATVYYLARMLQAGEDPKFIARRMVVFASEDVGMAAPAALNIATSTFLAVERVGMPECEHNLYHCAIILAKTDKSRQVVEAINKAKELAKKYPDAEVPFHLRSKATRNMLKKAHKNGSKKAKQSDYSDPFLPESLKDIKII